MMHILTDILPTAGVGGILALVCLYFYQSAMKQSEAKLVEMSSRWEKASEGWVRIVQENTAAIVRLTERLDR